MRLLHISELRFQEFFDDRVPPYAILSHRWDDDEVLYQELQDTITSLTEVSRGRLYPQMLNLPRFDKIRRCCVEVSRQYQFTWVWIDTCCINKDSSSELSEAINSMYRWYADAGVCLVYMSDVHWKGEYAGPPIPMSTKADRTSFMKSAWFTRGWTLQELLAPEVVHFFDANWKLFSTLNDLAPSVSQVTYINLEFLQKPRKPLSEACVAQKMSWLSMRTTSRVEDMAYCMLGILDINMPILYGEGAKAFLRLQLEFIRNNDDESIFAWRKARWNGIDNRLMQAPSGGLFALWPTNFKDSGHIATYPVGERLIERSPYAMTNQGLQIQIDTFRGAFWGSDSCLRGQRGGSTGRFPLIDFQLNCYDSSKPPRPYLAARSAISITLKQEVLGQEKYWLRDDVHAFGQTPEPSPQQLTGSTIVYIRQRGL